MFLNWVYDTNNSNSAAFSDNAPPPNNIPIEYIQLNLVGPGEVRAIWMQEKMDAFFGYYGW